MAVIAVWVLIVVSLRRSWLRNMIGNSFKLTKMITKSNSSSPRSICIQTWTLLQTLQTQMPSNTQTPTLALITVRTDLQNNRLNVTHTSNI